MSKHTEALSRRASLERERLSSAFDALEKEVDDMVDWRMYVRREPMFAIGIAALGGAILGIASVPRRRAGQPLIPAAARAAGEAVVGESVPAALLRRAGGLVLDLVATRALSALSDQDKPRRRSASAAARPP